ncbi:hypothetical protein [Streptococcus sp.]|uniref:hypothetical protein n=1 Tax=Streptococcus sp. TaxID=1306 RepID=UPI00391A693D
MVYTIPVSRLARIRSTPSNPTSWIREGNGRGLSYQIPTSEHLLEMQNVLKRSLGLLGFSSIKTNIRVYENLFGLLILMRLSDAYTGVETPGTGLIKTNAGSSETTIQVTTGLQNKSKRVLRFACFRRLKESCS